MELLVLIAVVLLGLSVLISRITYVTIRLIHAPPVLRKLHKITDAAVAHQALVEDADAFSNRPVPPFFVSLANRRGVQRNDNVSSAPYGPHWRVLRCNITAETLHPSRLGHLAQVQWEAIQDLITALTPVGVGSEKEPRVVAVRGHLEAAVYGVVVRQCFGNGVDECLVRAMCSATKGFQLAIGAVGVLRATTTKLAHWRQQRQLFALHSRMAELCLPLIAARRARPNDDDGVCRPYVDSFAHLRVPEDGDLRSKDSGHRSLTDDEMVSLVLEFLGSGAGPVLACLEWTLAHLVAQPDLQKKLRREVDCEDFFSHDRSQLIRGMPYLHAVVLESLRMHPPVPLAVRHVQAATAAMLGENSDLLVLFLPGEMGRDSKTWKDPDEFRPERFLPGGEAEGVGPLPGRKEIKMMPFGAGHRFCPGVGMAMVIIKCFLAALVRGFEWAPPTSDAVVDLTELDGFITTMKNPISACLTPHT